MKTSFEWSCQKSISVNTQESSIMKDIIKAFIVLVTGLIGAAIPLSFAYFIWAACMAAVPVGAYAGLIKIAISIALFMVGGGLTIWLTVIAVALGASLAAAVLDL